MTTEDAATLQRYLSRLKELEDMYNDIAESVYKTELIRSVSAYAVAGAYMGAREELINFFPFLNEN